MGRPLSPKDLERVREAVAKLEGAAETTDADWAKLRTEFKRLTVTKLAELREQAQADLQTKRALPTTFDLNAEFQRAVACLEETKRRMDVIYQIGVDGVPVHDPGDAKFIGQKLQALNASVNAEKTKLAAVQVLTKLLNLMAPEQEDAEKDSELEKGVREYFGGLFPDSESLPAIEILRLAYQRLEAVEMAEKRKLRVVG